MQETRKKLFRISIIALAVTMVLVAYFMVMTVLIPVSRFKIEISREKTEIVKAGKRKNQPAENIWHPVVEDSLKSLAIDILNRKSFLLSKLEMTRIDSISMAVSLKDSTVALVVQGVTIYSTKIQSYTISNIFYKTNPFVLAEWLSTPFIVSSHYASIPQVPVLYKKAPKDTIEAMNQLEMDPLKDDIDPVYFILNLDRRLTLSFEQAEKPEKGTYKQYKIYKKQLKAGRRNNIFSHLARFEPVEFIPEINIVIDKKAARVIYRALPVDALVAIQL